LRLVGKRFGAQIYRDPTFRNVVLKIGLPGRVGPQSLVEGNGFKSLDYTVSPLLNESFKMFKRGTER
jgi:hypothetical protein